MITRCAATPAATPAARTPTAAPNRPARRLTRARPSVSLFMFVHPTYPEASEPSHDLIVDGADGLCPVVGGRFAVVSRAEQHRHVARGDRVVTTVDHDLVHADPSGDRSA